MPKVPSKLPLSGLFAVYKPSGPPSMTIVNEIKPLVARSRLFVEADKLKKAQSQQKGKGKGYKAKYGRDAVKIGQGGTLDPLADGVLGIYPPFFDTMARKSMSLFSHRRWKRYEKAH